MGTPGSLESRANPSSSSGTATSQQRGQGRDLLPSGTHFPPLETAPSLPEQEGASHQTVWDNVLKMHIEMQEQKGSCSRGRSSWARAWQEVCATAEASCQVGRRRRKAVACVLPDPQAPTPPPWARGQPGAPPGAPHSSSVACSVATTGHVFCWIREVTHTEGSPGWGRRGPLWLWGLALIWSPAPGIPRPPHQRGAFPAGLPLPVEITSFPFLFWEGGWGGGGSSSSRQG